MTSTQYFNERREILSYYSDKINGLRKRMSVPTAKRTDCFLSGADAAKAAKIEELEEERGAELKKLKNKEGIYSTI